MIGSLLALGFLLGVKHALEADHVAAVATLATRSASLRERAKLGGAWGIGHALTIFGMGAGVLLLGLALPPGLDRVFEAGVGLLLVLLGADVLRRLRRDRVHIHVHRHADGAVHLHAHAHAPEEDGAHDPDDHAHEHAPNPVPRALFVGGAHGLAGSAALVLLSAEAASSTAQAFVYLAAFAIGSILGMTALSLVMSLPLRSSRFRLLPLSRGLQAALGIFSIGFGLWIAVGSILGLPGGGA